MTEPIPQSLSEATARLSDLKAEALKRRDGFVYLHAIAAEFEDPNIKSLIFVDGSVSLALPPIAEGHPVWGELSEELDWARDFRRRLYRALRITGGPDRAWVFRQDTAFIDEMRPITDLLHEFFELVGHTLALVPLPTPAESEGISLPVNCGTEVAPSKASPGPEPLFERNRLIAGAIDNLIREKGHALRYRWWCDKAFVEEIFLKLDATDKRDVEGRRLLAFNYTRRDRSEVEFWSNAPKESRRVGDWPATRSLKTAVKANDKAGASQLPPSVAKPLPRQSSTKEEV